MTGEFNWFWSVVVPASVLLLSFVVALGLYRHFSRH